jgi:alkylation response protein AidB-like acyl-CoA dehydrogenase
MSSATTSLLSLFGEQLPPESPEVAAERVRVREFLAEARDGGLLEPQCDSWLSGHSPDFSRELGRRGWIGMTWPKALGGRESSTAMRFAVIEELLAAGAPVAAHWFSDRQIGPGLLRAGTPEQRAAFLPAMALGELYFCIGMSEPDSGSDLGSVRTRAVRTEGGWKVSGSKIWTSHAQHAHHMLALVRTGAADVRTAEALTQVIVDMSTPGLTVRPIRTLDGREHFCEVFLDDVLVPDDRVLGVVGNGWRQVLAELAFERSGPERFLSTFPLLAEVAAGAREAERTDPAFGELVARLLALRAMSGRVARRLAVGEAPGTAAAVVKDLGTRVENASLDRAREWLAARAEPPSASLRGLLDHAQAHGPGFTLRGGTNEVLRDIVARALEVS